jgi:hypothetical protein
MLLERPVVCKKKSLLHVLGKKYKYMQGNISIKKLHTHLHIWQPKKNCIHEKNPPPPLTFLMVRPWLLPNHIM